MTSNIFYSGCLLSTIHFTYTLDLHNFHITEKILKLPCKRTIDRSLKDLGKDHTSALFWTLPLVHCCDWRKEQRNTTLTTTVRPRLGVAELVFYYWATSEKFGSSCIKLDITREIIFLSFGPKHSTEWMI